MKVTRKILLLILMLALAVCVLAVTTFAEETVTTEESVTPSYKNYAFTDNNALAVFEDKGNDTYSLVGTYTADRWDSAVAAAASKAKSVIYLRSDVTPNNNNVFVDNKTTSIIVDLNGYTLNKTNEAYIIASVCKAPKTDLNITFKNGTMRHNCTSTRQWRGFFQYAYEGTNTVQDAVINYTFDKVKFYDVGTGSNDFIFSWAETGKGTEGIRQLHSTVIFNNCELYPASVRNFFDSADSGKNIDITFVMNGGKIENSTYIPLSTLIKINDGDAVIFGQGENGNYTEFVYPNSVTVSEVVELTDDTGVKRKLVLKEHGETNSVYHLTDYATTEETTPYGKINYTSDRAPDKYPIAVFIKSGSSYALRGLYNDWRNAILGASVYDNAVIYFRDNVTNGSANDIFLNGKMSNITVDLNGKTLYKKDAAYIIMTLCQTPKTDVDITFKNGSMVHQSASWRGFFQLANDGTHKSQTAYVDYTFDNVNFIDNRTQKYNSSGNHLVFSMAGNGGTQETVGTAVLNNCELSPAKDVNYIFDFYDGGKFNVKLTMNGGKIVSGTDITMSKLIRANSGSDSVTFGNYNGQYTEFVYPNSVAISNTVKVTDDFGNTRVLAKKSNDDTNTTYELAEKTPYGLLTGLTSSQTADKAQLVLFEDKGNNTYARIALYSGADWDDAFMAAYVKTKTVIYFRADITPRGDNNLDNNVFINDRTTTVTVDMNGKTLYKKGEAYLIQLLNKNKAVTNVNVTFKNGTMVHTCTSGRAWRGFFQFAAETTHTEQTAIANYTFDKVNFIDNRTTGSSNDFIFSIAGQTANEGMLDTNINIDFNNCELSPANGVKYIFNFNNSSKLNVALAMNGGKIVSSIDLTATKIFNGNAGIDSITFGTGTNGYTTVELASGKTIDTASVWHTTDGIDCVFVKTSNGSYTLYPSVMVGYKIKTSVTLYSNFVYNVYIPKTNVNTFTINGNTLEYEEVVIDEVNYYHVKVELAAGNALEDIKVAVTLNAGEKTVTSTWTVNVFNYTKSVINGNFDETTKTLMKDMLAYASAAHTYFNNTEDVADKLAEIESILDGYNQVLPTGESKKPANDTYFESVAVYLGEVPSFRFYLAENYTADDFTFKVGVRNATVIEGDGYIEIVMYAYMMLDDVTFTVKGTDISESYNLYSYHDFATNPENADSTAELVAIVEALMKYSVSARAYRDSVINN